MLGFAFPVEHCMHLAAGVKLSKGFFLIIVSGGDFCIAIRLIFSDFHIPGFLLILGSIYKPPFGKADCIPFIPFYTGRCLRPRVKRKRLCENRGKGLRIDPGDYLMASRKVVGNEAIVLSRAHEILYVCLFAPVKARCLVYGDGSDAIRLTFCESIII